MMLAIASRRIYNEGPASKVVGISDFGSNYDSFLMNEYIRENPCIFRILKILKNVSTNK